MPTPAVVILASIRWSNKKIEIAEMCYAYATETFPYDAVCIEILVYTARYLPPKHKN